jgi:hypothetical protein
MKSLPTTETDPYILERSVNDAKITQLFASLFPDTPVPYEFVFDIVRMLESTKVNARILPEVIRGIYNLNTNDRRGQVIIHVQKDLTNVQIRENSETMSTLMEDENS